MISKEYINLSIGYVFPMIVAFILLIGINKSLKTLHSKLLKILDELETKINK